ncbi:MAG: methyltransferase domain-containing protein [Gammaproteobacteria bacterium]|nr:methyltransferase domain-containing protein [Gammaproteobacteria bacterium]
MRRRDPAKFWDRIAERYSKKPVADEAAYQKKLRVTREYFRPGMDVLEIGCGTGSTAIAHAPHVKHILATDLSSKMIAIARAKAEAAGIENLGFEQATIEQLSIPDRSLDAVLALSVLHLLQDKEAAIARVHGMLKPGGLFVTSTVCLGDTMKFFKLIGPIGRLLGLMPLVRVFTVQELTDSLTDAGFAIDYQWLPGKGKAVFIVARKADPAQPQSNNTQ